MQKSEWIKVELNEEYSFTLSMTEIVNCKKESLYIFLKMANSYHHLTIKYKGNIFYLLSKHYLFSPGCVCARLKGGGKQIKQGIFCI